MTLKSTWILSLASTVLISMSATSAQADVVPKDSCQKDMDCGTGFVCESHEVSSCTPEEPVHSGDVEDPGDEPNCITERVSFCAPAPPPECDPAQGSAQCLGAHVCVTYTFEECTVQGSLGHSCSGSTDVCSSLPSCSSDDDEKNCQESPQEQPECTSKSKSYCVPPFLAPCQADNDCGEGFSCIAQEVCTPCPVISPLDKDGSEIPSECDSTCTTSSTKYCQLQKVECTSDSQCALGLECDQLYAPQENSSVDICRVDSETDEKICNEEEPTPPIAPVNYCLPQGWERWGYATGSDVHSATNNAARHFAERVGGESGGQGSVTLVDAKSARDEASTTDLNDAGGCSTSGTKHVDGTGLGLLTMLGVMCGVRRRKKPFTKKV